MPIDTAVVAGSSLTYLLALCIYREARGENQAAQEAVASVVLNRAARKGWWGSDVFSVIMKPYQFSSFNKGEPNSVVFGEPNDPVWQQCYNIADVALKGLLVDRTGGAFFYYDRSLEQLPKMPPIWAKKYKYLCSIGAFKFFTDKF